MANQKPVDEVRIGRIKGPVADLAASTTRPRRLMSPSRMLVPLFPSPRDVDRCGPGRGDGSTTRKKGGVWRVSPVAITTARLSPPALAGSGSRPRHRARPGQAPCLWHLSRGSA